MKNDDEELKELYNKLSKIFEHMTMAAKLASELAYESEKNKQKVSELKASAIVVLLADLNLLLSIEDPSYVSYGVKIFHDYLLTLQEKGFFNGNIESKFNNDLKGKIISKNVSTKLQ